ncbi:hypothetical protein D3C87_95050 [compost metagenome]
MKRSIILLYIAVAFIYSCQSKEKPGGQTSGEEKITVPEWQKPEKLAYEIKNTKLWLEDSTVTASERNIVYAVNRTDQSNFKRMDSVIVPVDLSGDLVYYLPFPLKVDYLQDVEKIVLFSYSTQAFAVYEKGVLVRTGQTNMGSKKHTTKTGLFFTNWKARKTISTFNDEWELKWNFNIANEAGIGWHQYTLPGYPASHSCLRLNEEDAKYLYTWADQWVLENKTKVLVKGTPVIVFGTYDFDSPKPWLQLLSDPHALDIPESEVKKESAPFLEEILREQETRKNYNAGKNQEVSVDS